MPTWTSETLRETGAVVVDKGHWEIESTPTELCFSGFHTEGHHSTWKGLPISHKFPWCCPQNSSNVGLVEHRSYLALEGETLATCFTLYVLQAVNAVMFWSVHILQAVNAVMFWSVHILQAVNAVMFWFVHILQAVNAVMLWSVHILQAVTLWCSDLSLFFRQLMLWCSDLSIFFRQ